MKRALSITAIAGSLIGCGDEGVGSVVFTTWGEEYIEQGIPADAFADGYSVKYTKFLIVLGQVVIDGELGTASTPEYFLVNQVEPGVKPIVTFDALDAGSYTRASYVMGAASPSVNLQLVGGATQSDADRMKQNGYHLYVEGTLEKGGMSKSFAWGFSESTTLEECEGDVDGKLVQGVVVTDGGKDVVELTIHGDHLFYDDLQSPSAVVRGDVIFAADANMDDVIDMAELEAVKLTTLPSGQYGTGGVAGVDDLGAFVSFLSKTVGHWRGEGECFIAN